MLAHQFPQNMRPQFSPATAANPGPVSAPISQFNGIPQGYQQAMLAQQQRLYAMQMQNQSRPGNVNNPALAGRPGSSGINAISNPQQMAAPRHMQQNMAKPANPESFIRSLQKFMASRNLSVDPNPIVSGRPINILQLYAMVIKIGGSRKVTMTNMWPAIAQQLNFPPTQFPMAAQEIRDHYQRNLALYEQAILSTQQRQFADQMQQNTGSRPAMQSPVKSSPRLEPAPQVAYPLQDHDQKANEIPSTTANGSATPTQSRTSLKQQKPQRRSTVNRQSLPLTVSQPPAVQLKESSVPFAGQSPSQPEKTATSTPAKASETLKQPDKPLRHRIEDPFEPMVLPPSNFHGPIIVDDLYQLGEEISKFKPSVPAFTDLGVIDIHALTMCLQSGLHAEMRVALDTLTTISCEPTIQISLENCDNLVESLIDCAEDQADLLAEHSVEVSDVMLLPSYEEVTRACQLEISSLADVPEFGSLDYELDRAVDRLICITTILRNFSFSDLNFRQLGVAPVIQFISTMIRYLGTRNRLLRTQHNTLDFMKDAVIFLSNLAHTVQLPGREEALCLVHFLLSFAPSPAPTIASGGILFPSFNPAIHRYTPAAVDCLAKLLARDDPNRTFFRAIFCGDGAFEAQQELLTRAFGLAMCALPDEPRRPISDARKVFLMQGLLAADILSAYADASLAKSWLESVDGFAMHLLRLCCILLTERLNPQNPRQSYAARSQMEADIYAYGAIINRGLCILRNLAEKSKNVEGAFTSRLPAGIVLQKESLLGALLMPHVDPDVVRQLIYYAQLDE